MSKLYVIRNSVNDKVYVGQTNQSIEQRFRNHKSPNSKCIKLRLAMTEIGFENFYIEHICSSIDDNRWNLGWDTRLEELLISQYNSKTNGYNK